VIQTRIGLILVRTALAVLGGVRDLKARERILAGVVAAPVTVYVLLIVVAQLRRGFDPMGAIFGAFAGTIAVLAWWYALRGHIPVSRQRIRFAVFGGCILGGIGFLAGFFGPLILSPEANQGPLLGILITGPLGFFVGAVLGWFYASIRIRTPGGKQG